MQQYRVLPDGPARLQNLDEFRLGQQAGADLLNQATCWFGESFWWSFFISGRNSSA